DTFRPCGHTAVPVDEYPCNPLGFQQGSGINSVFEDCCDLCPASLVLMSPKPVADQHPMMSPSCDKGAQVISSEHRVDARLVSDPLECSNVAARDIYGRY